MYSNDLMNHAPAPARVPPPIHVPDNITFSSLARTPMGRRMILFPYTFWAEIVLTIMLLIVAPFTILDGAPPYSSVFSLRAMTHFVSLVSMFCPSNYSRASGDDGLYCSMCFFWIQSWASWLPLLRSLYSGSYLTSRWVWWLSCLISSQGPRSQFHDLLRAHFDSRSSSISFDHHHFVGLCASFCST